MHPSPNDNTITLPTFNPRSADIQTTDLLTIPPSLSPRLDSDAAIKDAGSLASSQTIQPKTHSNPKTPQSAQQHGQVIDLSALAAGRSFFIKSHQAALQDGPRPQTRQPDPRASDMRAPNIQLSLCGCGISTHS